MKAILFLCLLILLAICAYEDFRYKAVHWVIFLLLFIVDFIYILLSNSFQSALGNVMINSGFLLIQNLALVTYYSLKKRQIIFLINKYIGLGDILFLFSLTPLFTFPIYLVFVLLSMNLVLVIFGAKMLIMKSESPQIPLAGFQAGFLLLYSTMNYIFPEISLSKLLSGLNVICLN